MRIKDGEKVEFLIHAKLEQAMVIVVWPNEAG